MERNNRSRKEARKKELVRELGRIINVLKKDKEIRSIMLFGSLARGDISATSDIDVIIVKGTKKKFLDRLDEIYSTLIPNVALDILVYTPEEFEAMKNTNVSVMNAVKEGKMLYEP
ncbi:MAG: hypothetical protein C4B59_01850 [Candidatus Methanogaster sp.]|uniref:Uncharacterized protein n=1 Tax=Candidatus Methanogaster sp. TaxID=3386292 RepID=A0AC61L6I1_9EURY|nr:MAG: hypothetical protein C4B59_01850 [ANME-2 cluster archaeon]